MQFMVPRSSVYRVVCEYLESSGIAHIMEASECFRQMVDELAEEINQWDEQPKWVLGKTSGVLYDIATHPAVVH